MIAVLAAGLLGLVWEMMENLTQITFINVDGYKLNTVLDIGGDLLGGLLACLYFIQRKKCVVVSEDTMHPFYNQTGLSKCNQ